MYAGTVVERAEVDQLFKNPQHPYTRGLLKSVPKINNRVDMLHTIEGVVLLYRSSSRVSFFTEMRPTNADLFPRKAPALQCQSES